MTDTMTDTPTTAVPDDHDGAGTEDRPETDETGGTDLVSRWEAAGGMRPRRRWLTAVAAVVIVALAVATGWLAWSRHSASATTASRHSAVTTASHDATALATYRYTDLKGFLAEVKGFSTAGFSSSFDKGASSLTSILTQYKATSTGKVLSAGIVSDSGAKASVLVVVSQSVANTAATTPSAQTEAFTYGLVRSGGRWLLDSATAVGH